MSDDAAVVATGHLARLNFDQRGARYDTAAIHRRVVDILVAGAAIEAGLRVLDVTTQP
jgi:hypothetical protein